MPADLLYFTTVRVVAARANEWDRFYADYARIFATEVPGCDRGSRWRVTRGLSGGSERVDERDRPMFQAIFEHPRFDGFILSRQYRSGDAWKPQTRSFDPWYRWLSDYATIHLHRISDGDGTAAPSPAMLSTIWTIEGAAVPDFEPVYRRAVLEGFAAALPGLVGLTRYVGLLAQLHRHGDETGKLVIPQRHHFEDRKTRLPYATLFELERLPDAAAQDRLLSELDRRIRMGPDVLADRLEAFAERRQLVERAVPSLGMEARSSARPVPASASS